MITNYYIHKQRNDSYPLIKIKPTDKGTVFEHAQEKNTSKILLLTCNGCNEKCSIIFCEIISLWSGLKQETYLL